MLTHWKKILVSLLAGAALLSAVLFFWLFQVTRPTRGTRIGTYPAPRTALLVVDIQEDFTGPAARVRYRDGDRIVAVTQALLTQAQAKGQLVVFIQNVVENPLLKVLEGGLNAPGAPGTEMDRRLSWLPGTRAFSKGYPDAFTNPQLDAWLRMNQVDQLIITGLDAAHCVNATTRGALNRGYKVTLVADGLATESGTPMAKLIAGWRQAGAVVIGR